MIVIEPSILSADYMRLGKQVEEAEAAGITAFQIDVMDGQFVPNITFGTGMVKALAGLSNALLDVHLMIVQPERYLADFVEAGAGRIIVHQETCLHLDRTLNQIKELGIQAGVTLNPGTPLNTLEEILHLADMVQIMTVNPGFGGQAFIESQLGKIRRLRQMLNERGLNHIPIAVDGGIDSRTAPQVVQAGATILVAGSSIYNLRSSVAESIAALQNSLKQ
jgi:ribulose-phosphate 3-epimerase